MYATELRLAIFLAFVGFVLFLVARQSRNRLEILRLHLEGRNRLIERFGDAEAFLAFARSEEGRAALRAPDTGDAGRAVPGLRLFQGAIVSLALGVGLVALGGPPASPSSQEARAIGALLLSAGAGLALAGALAWNAARTAARGRQ